MKLPAPLGGELQLSQTVTQDDMAFAARGCFRN